MTSFLGVHHSAFERADEGSESPITAGGSWRELSRRPAAIQWTEHTAVPPAAGVADEVADRAVRQGAKSRKAG